MRAWAWWRDFWEPPELHAEIELQEYKEKVQRQMERIEGLLEREEELKTKIRKLEAVNLRLSEELLKRWRGRCGPLSRSS